MSGPSDYQPTHPALRWIERRLPIMGLVHSSFVAYPTPRNLNYWWTFGAILSLMLGVQVLTGVILAMYYKPDPNSAYQSVQHITNDVTLGWLVSGMHRWGASVFIILIFFHMARVFLFGAYKYPRELNWIVGALLVPLALLEGFSGYLLPYDQTAYWATVVGININGTAPFLGPYLASFLRGGSEIGPETLARFYSIHMLLLPGAILGLIGLHLYLIVRLGVSSPPWSREAAGREREEAPAVPGSGLVNPAPRGVTKRPD